ncbi:hypothetical protein FS837_003729 [Tulasnella sp. UAMH 9824]|nr:hypothetical protein FS837_003729 [Tulasnella sp. UAMH 9824]
MLSTHSGTTYNPPASLSYRCDSHQVPTLDAEQSDTDCPTETETETPPDSPVRPIAGSSSNKKSALDIVQATSDLSLITKEPITRRSTPEVGDDPGYIAEGETKRSLVGGKRVKKAFPAPEGPIWFRRRATGNSRSPSPRLGSPSSGSHQTTPLASRSASPASRLGTNHASSPATPRALSTTRLVDQAGQPSPSPKCLAAVVPSPLPASTITCPSSPSDLSFHDKPASLDMALPPRPTIFPEASLPDDLNALSPLELPAPMFVFGGDHKQLPPSQPPRSVPTSVTAPLFSPLTTTVQSKRTSQPPPLSSSSPFSPEAPVLAPLPEIVEPFSCRPPIVKQPSIHHSIAPHIKTPPGLLSVSPTPTGRPFLPFDLPVSHHPHLATVPSLKRRWSASPPLSPFASSPLGLGLRRVPLDMIPDAGRQPTARDGNGVVPPGWFVPQPLSPTTAAVVETRSIAKASSGVEGIGGGRFNPYFPSALTSAL